jgi:hypothetical protein
VPQNIVPIEANITKQSPAQNVSWKFSLCTMIGTSTCDIQNASKTPEEFFLMTTHFKEKWKHVMNPLGYIPCP